MVLHERTVWADHFVSNISDTLKLSPDYDSIWWSRLNELCEALLACGKNKFVVSLTDIHGPADHLAAVRGSESLAMDMIDEPQNVHLALEKFLAFYLEFYNRHWNMLNRHQVGTLAWQGWWAPGKTDIIQEDFSDLLSPAQYQEFIFPIDQQICNSMEHTLFHIHGTMIRLCPILAELKGLNAIQWPSENLRGQCYMPMGPYLSEWKPHIAKIQAMGKGVYLVIRYDEVEEVIKQFDPRRLLLHVKDCPDKKTANEILGRAVDWTQSRIKELADNEIT
jgi:hypothetical protein